MNLGQILEKVEDKKSELGIYYYMFRLMALNGLRVSEALAVEGNDILSGGAIVIKGKKGSNSRIVQDSANADYYVKRHNLNISAFDICNRFTARRLLQKIGIDIKKEGLTNRSQTHAFREIYFQEIKKTTLTKQEIANQVGHKSLKSQEHYGKKTK
jgi:integrase